MYFSYDLYHLSILGKIWSLFGFYFLFPFSFSKVWAEIVFNGYLWFILVYWGVHYF
jgi:hypothetical protein